jgi:hypothetical protein
MVPVPGRYRQGQMRRTAAESKWSAIWASSKSRDDQRKTKPRNRHVSGRDVSLSEATFSDKTQFLLTFVRFSQENMAIVKAVAL